MNSAKYESPEIQVISIEPDECLMEGGDGVGSMGTEPK